MKYLTYALVLIALLPALINAFPSTVVVNGRCLTCANPDGDPVYIGGQEYRSFSNGGNNVVVSPPRRGSGNVIINRPGYDGGGTIYQRGGNTVVNGRCEICNVDI